ncbi:MAG: c-type cytochrome [Candidatus Eremiobacteraeota bacterium]|nr:c-type cytochrome [Candidatus Eremiobacteraeota bacterium]
MRTLVYGLITIVIGAAIIVFLIRPASSSATTTGPSFTAAQASAGKTIYSASCAQCHGADLSGGAGPALAGAAAQSLQVSSAFQIMTTQMPPTNPGKLTHDQYVKLMAYILKQNGMKPGSTPLTFAAAQNASTSL